MEEQPLNFEVMLSYLYRALEGIGDPRQPSHAPRYSLRDLEEMSRKEDPYLVRRR